MAEEIIPGVFRLALPLPNLSLGGVNLYLLKSNDGWILVDTGMDHSEVYNELLQQLNIIGVKLKDIQLIILTHNHPDHSGLAGRLQEETNATLAIHEEDMVENIDEERTSLDSILIRNGLSQNRIKELIKMGKQMGGTSKPFHADWLLKGDERIIAGDYEFKVLLTPGHTSDHICLYDEKQQVLLSGDHILPNTTPNIGYGPHNPLGMYLSSLKQMKELPIKLTLPSHGEKIDDAYTRIDEIIHHHESRISQILNVVEHSNKTALSIAADLEWKGGSVTWSEMKGDEQSMAVLETLAHLQYIELKGIIDKIETKDFVYYQAI